MEDKTFITVLTLPYPYKIAVIRGRLEAEGIRCLVKDGMTVGANPFYSNAIGGVKLQVWSEDLNRAIEILKETGYIKEEKPQSFNEPSNIGTHSGNQQTVSKKAEIVCPFCGSKEVARVKKPGWLFLLTSLLFMFPTPFLEKKYYCSDCRNEFKLKK